MKRLFGLLSPLVLCLTMQGTEIVRPAGSVTVGETSVDFSVLGLPGGKLSRLDVNAAESEWSLTGSAIVNPDPTINYGFAFTNFSGFDLSFTILVTTPYVGGPYSFGSSSHSGSATDGQGVNPPDGIIIVSPFIGDIHQPFYDGTPFGAVTGGCVQLSGSAGSSIPCGLGNVPSVPIATGASGTLSVLLSGTVSAGDVYTFNGFAGISNLPGDAVPEPGTAGLAIAAFGALALARRRMAA